jgi:hypothetical protein
MGLAGHDLGAVLERRATVGRERDLPHAVGAWTRLTRSAGGKAGGLSRSAAMNSGSIARNARWSSRDIRRNSRSNRGDRANVGTG